MNPNELSALAAFIKEHDDYVIVCHENPDGDSLGSLFALQIGLKQLNKKVQAVCVDAVPTKYRSIAGADMLISPDQMKPFSHLICVDCADLARTGFSDDIISRANSIINIDHHISNQGYGQFNLMSSEVSATGILIYQLLEALGITIDESMASNLFIAISADTGHFTHANTDALCLRIASELVALGAKPNKIARDIFQTSTIGWISLLGRAIQSLEIRCDGRAAIMCLSMKDFELANAAPADVEGIIDFARNIESVEVAVLLRETAAGLIKVSMRSKDRVDVGKIASVFMGGGHMRAAGFSIDSTLLHAKQTMILSRILEGVAVLTDGCHFKLAQTFSDMSSQQAVQADQTNYFHARKAGHGGTLDPAAAGVLPVFLGLCDTSLCRICHGWGKGIHCARYNSVRRDGYTGFAGPDTCISK